MVGAFLSLNSAEYAFEPASQLVRTEQGYRLQVQLPGVSKDLIKVQTVGKRLVVSIKEPAEKAPVDRVLARSAHFLAPRNSQEYAWRMGEELDADSTKATFTDGVLTVEFATRAQTNRRDIEVA